MRAMRSSGDTFVHDEHTELGEKKGSVEKELHSNREGSNERRFSSGENDVSVDETGIAWTQLRTSHDEVCGRRGLPSDPENASTHAQARHKRQCTHP